MQLKQAEHLRKVSLPQAWGGGPEGWPLVRVARGKHHLTLEVFYMQLWGVEHVERDITPLAKKKKSIWGAKNLRFPSPLFQNF